MKTQTQTKITKSKDMFIVWKLQHRRTGIKAIDSVKSWVVLRYFFTISDATKFQNALQS